MPLVDDGTGGLTYQVIGCAMKAHNALGPGLKEEHYEDALAIELSNAGISFERQKPVEINLGESNVGVVILDLLVAEHLVVEVKARSWLLTNDEVGQVITYLAATELSVGLLINFGRRSLEFKRVFPPKKIEEFRNRINRYTVGPKTPPDTTRRAPESP